MNTPQKTLAQGDPTIALSQGDVAKAVEYWLNNEVLKVPGKVTYLSRQTGMGEYGFKVTFQEIEPEDTERPQKPVATEL